MRGDYKQERAETPDGAARGSQASQAKGLRGWGLGVGGSRQGEEAGVCGTVPAFEATAAHQRVKLSGHYLNRSI